MRNPADRELHQETVVTEDRVLEEDLLGHLLGAANEVGATEGRGRVVVGARHRRPAALAPDLVHHGRGKREGLVERPLRGLRDIAV